MLVLCSGLASALSAQTIKLGSLAPAGSPWDRALGRVAVQWNLLSEGRLVVKVFPGGTAGDEATVLRKIRIGQLQAAAITGVGLGNVCEEVYALQFPLLIRSDEELGYVMERLQPTVNRLLAAKGLELLAWFPVGWARFFARTPAATPEAMRRLKLHVDNSVPAIVLAWQKLGFHVVPLSSTEVLPALQSGMVEAFLMTPLTAAVSQWFAAAPNMLELKIAPMIAGVVVSRRLWDSLPEELKPALLSALQRELEAVSRETAVLESEALGIMRDHGLQVQQASPQAVAQWQELMDRGLELVTGSVVSAEMIEEVRSCLRVYGKERR